MHQIVLALSLFVLIALIPGCGTRASYDAYNEKVQAIRAEGREQERERGFEWKFKLSNSDDNISNYKEIDFDRLYILAQNSNNFYQDYYVKFLKSGKQLKNDMSDYAGYGELKIPTVFIRHAIFYYKDNEGKRDSINYYLEKQVLALEINSTTKYGKGYIGTNAFGVTTHVSESKTKGDVLASTGSLHAFNYSDIGKGIDISSIDTNKIDLYAKIHLTPFTPVRDITKNSIKTPQTPIGEYRGGTTPTIDHPYRTSEEFRVIFGKIDAMLVVNKSDGKILGKITFE